MLVPWRAAMPGYVTIVEPPVRALMSIIDDDILVARRDGLVQYTRLFPRARVSYRSDYASNPLVFLWVGTLDQELQHAMYPVEQTRPLVLTEYAQLYRVSLELPLFIALVLALPVIPWRRRIKPLLLGVPILWALHVFLMTCTGIYMSQREGNLSLGPAGQLLDDTPSFWADFASRFQYVGPVLAVVLLVAFLMGGVFDARRPKPQPSAAEQA